jgi:RNA polymerase sigma-70 factor (ECF subfamily)
MLTKMALFRRMSWTPPSSAVRIAVVGGVTSAILVDPGRERTTAIMSELNRSGSPGSVRETEPPDEALMARIAQGDRAAAQLLMQRRLPRVIGMAQRLLGDPVEAEDVAQDTFLRVWKAADRWESGRAKVSTWIGRIAINLCYDRLRRRREILTDEPPEQVDRAPDQETHYVRGETADRVAVAIRQLPERQQMALELVHFQELSNIEAADIMSISVDALESLLARGRRKLKTLLTEEAGELMSGYRSAPAHHEGIEG